MKKTISPKRPRAQHASPVLRIRASHQPGLTYAPERVLTMIRTNTSSGWMSVRERSALALFHAAAVRVPAYADFLKKNGIDRGSVNTYRNLCEVPATSKANYLREYPYESLLWDGDGKRALVFAATSGTTGRPFYFPHGDDLAVQYSILADLFLANGTGHRKLVIITFGMGVWIGGLFTFQAFERASERGANISIITPGLNKPEIINALRDLAPLYDETVVVGYPPFVKDALDEAHIAGIALRSLNLRLLFAAESFSERFRDHLVEQAGIRSPYLDTLNIYGTADIGAMAYETPTAILMRRLLLEEGKEKLFGARAKTPTLAQYNPLFTSFDVDAAGNVLLTGANALPLIRYSVGDTGGVASYNEVAEATGADVRARARELHLPLYELPFVYVYERADLSTKLYGAIIYPEHVREALQAEGLLSHVTGKFAMQSRSNEQHDQYLEVNVELRSGIQPSQQLESAVRDAILRGLLENNSEYANNYASMKDRVVPQIILWQHEDPKYFKPNIKQKWVIK